MASLDLRGDIWHIMFRVRGKQKSKSTDVRHDGKFKDGKPVPPPQAKRELRNLEAALDTGRSVTAPTVSDLLGLVEKAYRVAKYRSIPSLKSRIEHLRDYFGNLRGDRVTDNDYLEYADFRQQPRNGKPGAANKTIDNEWQMLMKALRMGNIHPLPKRQGRLAHPPARQGFFDDAMIHAVTKRLPLYLRGPVWFGYYTGWRREEVFGLGWSGIDFNAGEVRIFNSKAKPGQASHRVFPMDAVPGLRELLKERETDQKTWTVSGVRVLTPYVFARRLKDGTIRHRIVDFRKAFGSACRRSGFPGMVFHDLRRAACRNLELAGWPRSMTMEWMGHETESMHRLYRIACAADREIVSKVLEERRELNANRLKTQA